MFSLQDFYLRFFLGAGKAGLLLPSYRFLDERTLATERGGYAVFLRVRGLDEETLIREELDEHSKSLRLAAASLPEHLTLYTYARTRGNCPIEHHPGKGPARDRVDHLKATAAFRSVELRWCLYSNPPRRDVGSKTARAKAQGLRLRELRQNVAMLQVALRKLLSPRIMDEHEVAEFLSGLLNLESRLTTNRLTSRKNVGKQLARAPMDWTDTGLKIGKRHTQVLSLIKSPAGHRPNMWGELLSLECDLDICQEWRRRSNNDVRREIADQEGFLGAVKYRLQTSVKNALRKTEGEETANSKSSKNKVRKLSTVVDDIDDDGLSYGSFSMIGLLHSRDPQQIETALSELHRIISDPSQGGMMEEEPRGALAGYQAMFPGNTQYNVRRRWMQDASYTSMALIYQPFVGHVKSADLGGESLTIYGTLDKTPFYFDPYYKGVRGLIAIGPTGSGKSMNGNLFVDHDSKTGGFTTVYDIGGSYNSTILSHGGLVTRVGLTGPRFNPFRLDPTDKNIRAIYLLIALLLRKGGYLIQPREEKDLFERVKAHYWMEPAVRRLGCFILPDHMMPFLSKWTGDGLYGHIFDNEVDELQLARCQSFDFEDIGGEQNEDHNDLLEPVLFWLTYLKECERQKPENLGLPKHDVFDELWRQIKEPRMWSFILGGLKTSRKRLGGITLLTHHPDDLGDYAALIRNACPMTLFTGNPILPRDRYVTLFGMNDIEIESVKALGERQVFLKAPWGSKKLILDLDPEAYARYTTTPREIQRRMKLIEEHGLDRGIALFAEEGLTA